MRSLQQDGTLNQRLQGMGRLFGAGKIMAAADVGQADAWVFLAGVFNAQLARTNGALQEQPGCKLHEAGGEDACFRWHRQWPVAVETRASRGPGPSR